MKFSTFFGKYTICALIWSAITIVVGITGFGILCHIEKKDREKDEELNSIFGSNLNLNFNSED